MSYIIYLIDGFLFYAFCVVVVLMVLGLILFFPVITMFGKMSYVTNYWDLKSMTYGFVLVIPLIL